ncbi:ferritin-like domain-containing protein [Anabaena sphaerica FACHB-251]|uniref:Ferritin-like domain-containing protein n=1 Tax=Anabaena sphaerica FACHB-251 TaxID=2692883 RepID=A0A926WDR3_9NOST|nr:ferritin-like domain-containing protein [Anabaena sphaerica]MBD2292542.1 ferritin-like domain-containing protein [Anabaena sphaerica FACHB-251]
MSLKYNIVGFDLPPTDSDHRLRKILTAALPKENNYAPDPRSNYWDAEFFNLHQVKIFQESNIDEQYGILEIANLSLLTESYFIEKAGVGYMAKMVLLADTVEERMLYGLFTADEATHLHQITKFLPQQEVTSTDDPFLKLLSEVVESADKTVLLFVLQVVLEGWGLSHYRSLAKKCRYPVLAEIFDNFLQAESRHHATGTTLFNQMSVSPSSQTIIIEILAQFLLMVQVGPQNLLTAIEQVKGHLTRGQKIQILEEIDTKNHSGTRLKILRSLMSVTSANIILQTLEEQGAFQPLPANKCVY